jgi:site-specific DNA-methyltransferase (adenine-specific)
VDIRHGDFREVLADIPDGTVDAIITDPPYPGEFVGLFGDLSELAARTLKHSGVLAVMCGQYYLPEYITLLSSAMRYRWCGAYIAQGPRTRVHAAKVGTGWKPILVFQRHGITGDDLAFILDDLFDSAGDDKRHHHWGQSESGTGELVERLTQPGALVVDPFLGGGTTAVVCRDLGRRFIGCDIDAAHAATSRERLA